MNAFKKLKKFRDFLESKNFKLGALVMIFPPLRSLIRIEKKLVSFVFFPPIIIFRRLFPLVFCVFSFKAGVSRANDHFWRMAIKHARVPAPHHSINSPSPPLSGEH